MSGVWLFRAGLGLVALQVLGSLAGPWLLGFAPDAQDILARMAAPSALHPLGTDNFGRDTLARILVGYRTLFVVSFASVAAAVLVGGALGLAAAWLGGWLDMLAMRCMDVLFAFPIILLAIGVVAVIGPGMVATTAAIAVVYVPVFARTVRAPALQIKEMEFIVAARAVGAGQRRIVLRHLLPNLAPVILAQASLSLSTAILVEASLSFLGLGTQPPTASLGRMLAESRSFLALSAWPALFSGAAILLAAAGFNLLGDSLQDRLDPRLRRL